MGLEPPTQPVFFGQSGSSLTLYRWGTGTLDYDTPPIVELERPPCSTMSGSSRRFRKMGGIPSGLAGGTRPAWLPGKAVECAGVQMNRPTTATTINFWGIRRRQVFSAL